MCGAFTLNMIKEEFTVEGKHGRAMLSDITFVKDGTPKPIVVYAHGFKGFKDWGHMNKVAEVFANSGIVFVKFNFSHNGTTLRKPVDFADLDAFGDNNFTIELDDLRCVIDWLQDNEELAEEADLQNISVMGHSRGGGIVIIHAAEDDRIKKLVCWATVFDFERLVGTIDVKVWKSTGVVHVENSRTEQMMPLHWQLHEDYFKNEDRFNIMDAAARVKVPFLLVHGTDDDAVPDDGSQRLLNANPHAELLLLDGADHNFGGVHPFEEDKLPPDAQLAVNATIAFIKK